MEAEGRIMQEIPESLAEFATRELRGRGMEILTNTTLESAEREIALWFTDGELV